MQKQILDRLNNPVVIVFIIVLIVSIVYFARSAPETYPIRTTQETTVDKNAIDTSAQEINLNYEILDKSVYAPNGQKFYVLVPTDSEKVYVQSVAEDLVDKYKNESPEITIYFWDDERNYKTGSGYNVGTAEWNGGGITYNWKEKQNIIGSSSLTEPTTEELAIFDYYWAAFDEAGNPRGYTVHPTVVDSYTNNWEIERVDRVTSKYNLTRDELFEIVMNVSNWQDLH